MYSLYNYIFKPVHLQVDINLVLYQPGTHHSLCFSTKDLCRPRQKSKVERLKAKVEPLSTQVNVADCVDLPEEAAVDATVLEAPSVVQAPFWR
jgi:hypothetical protein